MHSLQLPACPICGATDSLIRQVPLQMDHLRIAYTCWQCGSVLAWLGDEMWLSGDRWAYQRVGCEDKRHLLHRLLTEAELYQLADGASEAGPTPRATEIRPDDMAECDITLASEAPDTADVAFEIPSPIPSTPTLDPHRPSAWGAEPTAPRGGTFPGREAGSTALVPLAKVLPEGMALALVRYDGSQLVPVAVFEGGQLRTIPTTPRRGRGSPLLLIGIGLTLLCLICSASAVVLSAWLDHGLALMTLPQPLAPWVPTATPLPIPSPAPTDTAAPTDTPWPTESPPRTQPPPPAPALPPAAVLEGVTDYVSSSGSHTIVGEVFNASGNHLRFVEVMASFYDGAGQLVGTGSTFAELSTVEPNDRVPFKLTTLVLPPSFQTYELHAAYGVTEQAPLRPQILSHQAFTADTGAYHVTGEVQNPYEFPVRFAQVVATYYNSAVQVVRVETTFTEAETLEPGQTSSFELILMDPPGDLSHYKLQTEAVQVQVPLP